MPNVWVNSEALYKVKPKYENFFVPDFKQWDANHLIEVVNQRKQKHILADTTRRKSLVTRQGQKRRPLSSSVACHEYVMKQQKLRMK